MEARIVQRAEMAPAKCAVSGDIDGPFIDTGAWCNQVSPYIYLHVPLVEFYARELLEMVPKAEVEALREQVESYAARIEQLEAFTEAHRAFADAVEGMQPETSTAGAVEVAA